MIREISNDNNLMEYLEDNDFNRNLTIFLSRNIYCWLIDPDFTSELKKGQKDLTALQINEIAEDLRNLISKGSLGKNFTEGLDKVSRKRFHKDFRKLQSRLKSDSAYNSTFLTYLQTLVNTVFRLVSGKYKISRLSGINQTITNYLLKDEACIEDNEFNRKVMLFLSRYIYRFIIHPTFKLDFKRNLLNPTTSQLNRIAKWLRRKVIRRPFPYEWLKKLDKVRREEFEENYEKLRTRLRLDQIFSCEYLTNLRNLAQFVFNLVVGKFNVSELEGFYREVAKYLGGLDTFMYDEEFSYNFKWSFIIVICRITYDSIVNQGYFKKSKAEREGIRADLTENGSIGIKLNILDSEIKYKYFDEVDLVSRKEFAEYYKKLQFRLNLDQIYGLTFMDDVRYFTTIVFDLIESKCGKIPSTNFIRFIGEDLLRNWDANLKHKWIPKATLSREPISQLMLNEKIEEYNKKLIEQDTMKDNKNYEFNGEKESNSRKEEEYTVEKSDLLSESRELIYRNEEIEKQNKEIDEIYAINIEDLENFKEKIKKFDWDESIDWTVKYRKNQKSPYITISLDPFSDCSKTNPLYRHEEWLKRVYNDKELQLNDTELGQICGLSRTAMGYWRHIRHNIPARAIKGEYTTRKGYKTILMPIEYQHPQILPHKTSGGKYIRPKHVIVMERYLAELLSREKDPNLTKREYRDLEIAKKYLHSGLYLDIDCVVHHINFIPSNNILENLWVYEDDKSHLNLKGDLFKHMSILIKLGQVFFKEGKYYFNKYFDFRKTLSPREIKEKLRPISVIPYKDIDFLKDTIKNLVWDDMPNKFWTVKHRLGRNAPYKEFLLNPKQYCSDGNPLYMHEAWVKRIVRDERFNLTNGRLGKLCGISIDRARHWRENVHNIRRSKHGFNKYVKDNRVWKRVPREYGNPFAIRNDGWMLEYRYIMERHLASLQSREISQKYLIDGKYLKSEYIVHHVNLDPFDNSLENLWICTGSEHRLIEGTLNSLIDGLLKDGFLVFEEGKYHLIF